MNYSAFSGKKEHATETRVKAPFQLPHKQGSQDNLVLIRLVSCQNFPVTLGITGAPHNQTIYGRQPGRVKYWQIDSKSNPDSSTYWLYITF